MAFLVERGRLEAIQAIDPVAAASTAVERAGRRRTGAVAGVRALLAVDPPGRFVLD